MSHAGGDEERRVVWTITAAFLVLALGLAFALRHKALDATVRMTSLLLLVVGAAAGGLALRRAGAGEPVTKRPGWRWVGAGAVLYIGAALGAFALLWQAVDAATQTAWLRSIAGLVGVIVPTATGWVLDPRPGEVI